MNTHANHEMTPQSGPLTPAEWEAITEASFRGGAKAWRAEVERIIAERVRVVEGERDAARVDYHYAAMEASAAGTRAESAEAAHEAEKAAHERLRAGVEALADEWEAGFFAFRHQDPAHLKIRALLAGGGERPDGRHCDETDDD